MNGPWLIWIATAGRLLLGVLFIFAGVSHFSELRHDFAAMIPDRFPQGMWVVYVTGILEIAGGVGLFLPRWKRTAAICLMVFLVAVFPANINAALRDIPFGGQPATPLLPRTLMQLVLIAALWWTSVRSPTV